jgi:cell division protein FtsX
MSRNNDSSGCSCLIIIIVAIGLAPTLFKGCVSCVNNTSKTVNQWQENSARESSDN